MSVPRIEIKDEEAVRVLKVAQDSVVICQTSR